MPNLIDVQRASYEAFLQMNVRPDNRSQSGLQEVFKSVFPIDDFAGRGRLEFVYYELEEPKYDVDECIQRGMTFAAPLKVILRLIVWDVDEDTGARSIRDIYKENAPTKRKCSDGKLRRESSSAGDIDCENGCCSAKRQDAIECGVL